MRRFTIPELGVLVNSKTLASPADSDQKNFQLVMKQIILGLPVESLLTAHPQIYQWVNQLKALVPEVFKLRKDKLLIDSQISAVLQLGDNDAAIEISTNVAFEGNKSVRLIEWAIRQAHLSWSDKVKFWVTSECLKIPPTQLKLTILALHREYTAERQEVQWNQQLHEETRQWLVSVLTGQLKSQEREPPAVVASFTIPSQTKILSIAEIEEVEI